MQILALPSLNEVEKVVNHLRQANRVYSIDLETTSVDPFRGHIVGVGISWSEDGAVYVPIRHRYDQPFDGTRAVELLRPLFTEHRFVAFNAVFELEFLKHDWDITPSVMPVDASILSYVEGRWDYQSLKTVCKDLFPKLNVESFHEFMVRQNLSPNKNQIDEVLVGEVAKYCGIDTIACMCLYNLLYEKLKDHPIYKLEARVLSATQKMRANGVLVDVEYFKKEEAMLLEQLVDLQKIIEAQVSDKAGEPVSFNIRSSKQLGDVLFDILRLPCDSKTAKGARKTDKNVMANLKWKHPIVQNIITFKEISKRLSTYYSSYLTFVQKDGRIHASYNQTGVVTGRFSCSDPNLQNIPRKQSWTVQRKQGSFEIDSNPRKGYVVPDDCWFVEFDYSQIEARIAAGITREPVLLNAFSEGVDYHTKTASLVYGVPISVITDNQRYMGKRLNFALSYGMGDNLLYFILRKDVDVSFEQTKQFRSRYVTAYATMFHEAEQIARNARRTKCVQTIWGRRVPVNLYLEVDAITSTVPELLKKKQKLLSDGDRMAYNGVIQGSAGDLLKFAMVVCYELVATRYGDDVLVILTTHDSLGFEVKKTVNLVEFIKDILDCMKVQIPQFPLFFAEYKVGRSWGELESPKDGESVELFVQGLGKSKENVQAEKMDKEVRVFVLEIPVGEGRTSEQLASLKKLLVSKEGDNSVILKIGENEKELPYKTAIGLDDRAKLSLIFGGKFYERL